MITKKIEYISLFLSILLFTYSVINIFVKIDFIYIIMINSLINFIISIIFKKNKDISMICAIFYITYIILSTFALLNYTNNKIIFLVNILLWSIYYLYNIKDNINPLFLIGLIYSILLCSFYFNFSLVYYLLFISFILFVSYELLKKEEYFVAGSIFMVITILNDFNNLNKIIYLVITMLFIYSYLRLLKMDKNKYLRMIVTFYGFFMIFKLIKTMINPIVIVSLITMFIYFVIMITMYLSEKRK